MDYGGYGYGRKRGYDDMGGGYGMGMGMGGYDYGYNLTSRDRVQSREVSFLNINYDVTFQVDLFVVQTDDVQANVKRRFQRREEKKRCR